MTLSKYLKNTERTQAQIESHHYYIVKKSRSLLQNNNKQTKKMSSSLSFETPNFLADNHLFFLSENFSEI